MNEEDLGKELLSAQQISILLATALPTAGGTPEEAYRNLTILSPCSAHRFENTLPLLIQAGIISRRADGGLFLAKPSLRHSRPEKIQEEIRAALLAYLPSLDAFENYAKALQYDESRGIVLVDSRLLPWRMQALSLLMLELDIFTRASYDQRHWDIGPPARQTFIECVKRWNLRITKIEGMNINQLSTFLDNRSKAGEEAEKWALEYEKRRLEGHPFKEQIRRLSETNIDAGYDLASFSSLSTLRYDMFIEVKSYAGKAVFYWSSNEIAKAKELGELYFIYLVDRTKFEDKAYIPKTIQNPYSYFFTDTDRRWSVEPDGYRIEES